MRSTEGPVSPKRRDDEHSSINGSAYKYYAAFSHTFVAQLLAELEIGKNDLLMDPWNGRGTTTAIAAEKGLRAIGFDLNPAMVAIAEARLVDGNWAKQAARKIEKLKQGSLQSYGYVDTTDSLLRWLSPSSVGFFRGLQAIFREIAAEKASAIPQNRETVINQRRLEYFLNLSLCSTLRDALKPLKTSNPTWIPQKLAKIKRLRPSAGMVLTRTRNFLHEAVSTLTCLPPSASSYVTVQQADSRFIPLSARSVTAVISSPPYCTRIDYAVATSPELFLLDLVSDSSFRQLRKRLLGTTITHIDNLYHPPKKWGYKCIETIAKIRRHPSKASDSYYVKNYLQYFSGLHDSLEEIDRVTVPGARMALVIQDSYYKEVHVDLPAIVNEMGHALRWSTKSRRDYPISSTMAASNPGSRTYRDSFGAVESVLIFEKHSSSKKQMRTR